MSEAKPTRQNHTSERKPRRRRKKPLRMDFKNPISTKYPDRSDQHADRPDQAVASDETHTTPGVPHMPFPQRVTSEDSQPCRVEHALTPDPHAPGCTWGPARRSWRWKRGVPFTQEKGESPPWAMHILCQGGAAATARTDPHKALAQGLPTAATRTSAHKARKRSSTKGS